MKIRKRKANPAKKLAAKKRRRETASQILENIANYPAEKQGQIVASSFSESFFQDGNVSRLRNSVDGECRDNFCDSNLVTDAVLEHNSELSASRMSETVFHPSTDLPASSQNFGPIIKEEQSEEESVEGLRVEKRSPEHMQVDATQKSSPTATTLHITFEDVPQSEILEAFELYEFGSLRNGPRTVEEVLMQCRKFHRFVFCEWFYSDIDRALFTPGGDGYRDFPAQLELHFPALRNRAINRAELNYVRRKLKQLGRGLIRRRCSQAFFYAERVRLELRREKVRFLQANPTIEYLFDDLPDAIPLSIPIGSIVKAQLIRPQYGIFFGTVVGVHEKNQHVFLVNFAEQFEGAGEQYIEDFRLSLIQLFALVQFKGPPEEKVAREMVTVPHTMYKQLVVLEEMVAEKRRLLEHMTNLRIATEWRKRNRIPIEPQDRANASEYLAAIKTLIALDRIIIRQDANMSALCASCKTDNPTEVDIKGAQQPQAYDREVVEVAEALLAAQKEYCERLQESNPPWYPDPDQLWRMAVQGLGNNPTQLDELRRYIQSTIGTELR